MESLVAQPGVPLLTFDEPANGKVDVSQKRFFLSPSVQSDPSQKWTLPVCFKTTEGHQSCNLLTPTSSALDLPASGLIFANAHGKGYYRTAYPASVYANLVANVETALTPVERISLLGDEWVQVRANKSSIGEYLDLVAAIKDDPNAAVLSEALSGYEAAYERIAATPAEKDALAAWIRTTFGPVYARLGAPTPQDSPNTRELRAQLFSALGNAKDPAILSQARQVAKKYVDDPSSIDAHFFGQTALAIAARNGDTALFDQLQKVAETSNESRNPDRCPPSARAV